MRSASSRSSVSLSDGVVGILRRRFAELSGFLLVVAAGICMAALATWSALDPSFNYATDGAARNLLGRPGAIFADFLMQILGLAAVIVVLPIAVWGWRFITHRWLVRTRVRLIAWFFSPVFAAGFAACLKPTLNWPLPSGLGGVVGDLLLKLPMLISGGSLSTTSRMGLAAVFGLLTVLALAIALGMGFKSAGFLEDDVDEDAGDTSGRAIVSLGAITHGFLALKARISRRRGSSVLALIREMFERDDLQPNRQSRREPLLNGGEARTSGDIDDEDEAPARRRASRASAVAPQKRRTSRGRYEFPPIDLLAAGPKERAPALSSAALDENSRMLESVLEDFGVRGEIVNAHPGPVVTLYELEPAPGIKSSRVIGLADDIARSMSAVSARVAVVPGRNAIGIELPNPKREKVVLREQIASK
jgi:S-DNA-T family DNA segregation ATPase FtsK/SpoIIIE